MERRSLLRLARILCVFACVFTVVLIYCIGAQGSKELSSADESRPDLITIDTLAAFGNLELPEVTFFHDKHTDALEKTNKDCKTCHLYDENNQMSLKFKRLKDTGSQDVKDIYHTNCIGCHTEMAAEGQKTGPVDGACRACHNDKPSTTSSWQPIGLDKILHYRHSNSKEITSNSNEKDNCGRCHHEYDKQTKKLFYAKGKEGTCRYCHLDKAQDDVKSMAQASHIQCVSCHKELLDKGKKDTGPVKCSGCHGPKGQEQVVRKNQELLKKIKEVPRVKREQPDTVLLTAATGQEQGETGKSATAMNPVPFDHKAHEKYNDTCRVCHHASIDSCSKKCHTRAGSEDGKYVQLEQAMHQLTSERSCMGCHKTKQEQTNCAGCHNSMGNGRKDESTCVKCHMKPQQPVDAGMTDEQKAEVAKTLLEKRDAKADTYSIEDIPEKVVIDEMVDKYEPVEFPHRKIVLKIKENMKDDKLATYFHSDKGTVCQGCHHNSPAAKKPPRCGNCHGNAFDERKPFRPGLKAAYHGQCMGCHKEMGIEKPVSTACNECHKERKK